MFTPKTRQKGPSKFPVRVSEDEVFHILYRKPSFEELCTSFDMLGMQGTAEKHFQIIVGWEGVQNEDGEDIPYTSNALKILCEDYPDIFDSICFSLQGIFRGLQRPDPPSNNTSNESSEDGKKPKRRKSSTSSE